MKKFIFRLQLVAAILTHLAEDLSPPCSVSEFFYLCILKKKIIMKSILLLLCLLSIALLFNESSCRKHHITNPANQLPPATQEGKNTFGCYVNGVLFLPKGSKGAIPNLSATIDPYWHDGSFGIRAYNTNWQGNEDIDFGIGSDSLRTTGTYRIGFSTRVRSTIFIDTCIIRPDELLKTTGYLKITRYDYDNGIVSGEFEMTIIGANCFDTLRIEQGRFDYKFQ